jgi:hypothetical protein
MLFCFQVMTKHPVGIHAQSREMYMKLPLRGVFHKMDVICFLQTSPSPFSFTIER